MTVVRSIDRTGALVVNGEPLGEVRVEIDVHFRGNMYDGEGTITGAPDLLRQALGAGKSKVTWPNGEVEIIIRQLYGMEGVADIVTSGPVPE